MNYALDASAMIAFVAGEPGGALIEELLSEPRNLCFAHAANLCEVYYDAYRRSGQEIASRLISDLARIQACGSGPTWIWLSGSAPAG